MRDETPLGQTVKVGIADGVVVARPARVRTLGLGSCVGVVLMDSDAGLAGMVHIMLPQSGRPSDKPAKYADLAIPWLVSEMCRRGAAQHRMKAKVAGGAQMFSGAAKSDILRVGPRNVEAVTTALADLGIPVLASDVGGNVGRTIEYDSQSGLLYIKTILRGVYAI